MAESAVVIVLLAGGLHWFMGWFVGARGRCSWSWSRSLAVLGAVLLLFATSIASAGLAHQSAWLLRDDLTTRNWRPAPDLTATLDRACRRADFTLGIEGVAAIIGEDPTGFDVDHLHYLLLDEPDRSVLLVFPRDPAERARLGGQKCLDVDGLPHAIPVAPEDIEAHIADPWLDTY